MAISVVASPSLLAIKADMTLFFEYGTAEVFSFSVLKAVGNSTFELIAWFIFFALLSRLVFVLAFSLVIDFRFTEVSCSVKGVK
ncbi:hypothetical protein AB4238_13060 [Shewanella sp. 10N.286.45.A1]|uniref:hypothetical protein n=1 Tax=Shewanella sp. 10N.286.45.A1 TaxID=3229694 RepID=UPI00355129D4